MNRDSKIGYLGDVSAGTLPPYKAWFDLSVKVGSKFEWITLTTSITSDLSISLNRLISEADGFVIPNDWLLHGTFYSEQIHKRIEDGARALVFFNPVTVEGLDRLNRFTARYDITGTSITLSSLKCDFGHPRVIRLKRDAHSFRDPALFAGVEEVVIQQPSALWYGGDSLPILMATDDEEAVNGITDYPADWNARELACACAWHGNGRAAVLVVSGELFHDTYLGSGGYSFPGINENCRLAQNVIQFLSGDTGRSALAPYEYIHRIEVNLVDFIIHNLTTQDAHWWQTLVPPRVREKAERRWHDEGMLKPRQAYLDLLDLKKTMDSNWSLFVAAFRTAGGVFENSEWINRLNEIRRMVMHPTKGHLSGVGISADDLDFLARCDLLGRTLFKSIPKTATH